MIRDVTETLVDHIQSRTPELGSWVVVHSLSQSESGPSSDRLVVALYAVEEHPHLRNRPLIHTSEGYKRPPLGLRLNYLMTYLGGHAEAQARLARVAQIFHTTPILEAPDLRPALIGLVDRVTVRLTTTSADQRNQVWTALGRPMRLGLFYEVDVAALEALEREGRGEIVSHRIDYGVGAG